MAYFSHCSIPGRPSGTVAGSINHNATEGHMKTNAGTLDRTLRIVAGIALVALAATGTVGAWGWIGVVPLATGLLGYCPAYSLFGINTCSRK